MKTMTPSYHCGSAAAQSVPSTLAETAQLNLPSGTTTTTTTLLNTLAKPAISVDSAFQERVDNADPFICHPDVLQGLLNDAPDQYAQGFLAGIYVFRQQLSIITARPF